MYLLLRSVRLGPQAFFFPAFRYLFFFGFYLHINTCARRFLHTRRYIAFRRRDRRRRRWPVALSMISTTSMRQCDSETPTVFPLSLFPSDCELDLETVPAGNRLPCSAFFCRRSASGAVSAADAAQLCRWAWAVDSRHELDAITNNKL